MTCRDDQIDRIDQRLRLSTVVWRVIPTREVPMMMMAMVVMAVANGVVTPSVTIRCHQRQD